jgi:hypothetical protein
MARETLRRRAREGSQGGPGRNHEGGPPRRAREKPRGEYHGGPGRKRGVPPWRAREKPQGTCVLVFSVEAS